MVIAEVCGICGTAGQADPDVIRRMTNMLAHRGPDDSGIHVDVDRRIALGHRRLSIIDLSTAGHQPMANDNGSIVLVFNGEIYNFRELREELVSSGVTFRSQCDTEVLLKLYERYGVGAVRRLNGIFAFALWDGQRDKLVLARDHFGVKPLYYSSSDGVLAFSSEAKALFEVPGLNASLDLQALGFYLRFLWTPDPVTLFDGVRKLPAGHYAEWSQGRLRLTRYWDLDVVQDASRSSSAVERELVTEFRHRFSDAVERQLVSDVPVGAFLSAGLDSSAIVAAMAERGSGPVRTYTITFDQRHRVGELTMDDPAVAKRTAARFGCKHTEIVVDPDVASLLPKLAWHMDEPTADPAVVMAYLVNREARSDVSVLLSGIGGDELLGGYRKYVAALDAQRYARLPGWMRTKLLDPLWRHAPARAGTPWAGYGRLVRKWGRSASLPPREQFLANGTYTGPDQWAALLTQDVAAELAQVDTAGLHNQAFDQVGEAAWLDQMLYVDLKIFMASLNLAYNDKMSMASSVEVRVPFLDRELAEWIAREVPVSAKVRGRTTKWLLRAAFADSLPREVLRQRKAGFGAPIAHWLRGALVPLVDDALSADRIAARGLFRPGAVEQIVREQRSGRIERAMQVWQLMTLELWMQQFLDGDVARSTYG